MQEHPLLRQRPDAIARRVDLIAKLNGFARGRARTLRRVRQRLGEVTSGKRADEAGEKNCSGFVNISVPHGRSFPVRGSWSSAWDGNVLWDRVSASDPARTGSDPTERSVRRVWLIVKLFVVACVTHF